MCWLFPKKPPERIRLSGINCCEHGQVYGQKAKHAASGLVFGKEVTLQACSQDKYRRMLPDGLLPDATMVNKALVSGAGVNGAGNRLFCRRTIENHDMVEKTCTES